MAYDAARNQVVLFGGGNWQNDTWVWDGTTWTQKYPATSPPGRVGAMMAYDAARAQIVLFGGQENHENPDVNDTWVWDGTTWTQKSPLTRPPGREDAAMAYDATAQKIVLFGGLSWNGGVRTHFNDTWSWSGVTWVQESPAASPPRRVKSTMAYDAVNKKMVLFGGYHDDYLVQTWTYDGLTWVNEQPKTSPGSLYTNKAAYAEVNQRVMLVDSGGDTWVWSGKNWIRQTPEHKPWGTPEGFAYDAAAGKLVLLNNSTWTWESALLTPPPPPTLDNPVDGGVLGGVQQVFTITATDPDGSDYKGIVEIRNSAGPVVTFNTATVASGDPSSGSPPLRLTAGTYTWSARALDGEGEISDPSPFQTFQVPVALANQAPTSPSLSAPADGTIWTEDSTQIFTIAASDPDGDQYSGLVEVRDSAGIVRIFTTPQVPSGHQTTGSPPVALRPGSYTWNARAVDDENNVSEPSASRQLSITAHPNTLTGPQNWTQQSTSSSPVGRQDTTMAYDAARSEVVLFGGGSYPNYLNDTWVWDGTTWTQKYPATSPPARFGAMMAYDAARAQIVLFGGQRNQENPSVNDTWVWDGTTWTQKSPLTRPPGREDGAMAYDATAQKIVLFGGLSWNGGVRTHFNDTWSWNGVTWVQESPTASPSRRVKSTMAYDAVNKNMVLFGGYGDNLYGSETWTYDGLTWTKRQPSASPYATDPNKAAYAEINQRVMLVDSGGETWVWSGKNWIRQTPAQKPWGSPAGLAYDAAAGKLVLLNNSTWTWQSAVITPPTTPTMASPDHGTMFAGGGPQVFTIRATDPDGTDYTGIIEIKSSSGSTVRAFTTPRAQSGESSSTVPPVALSPGTYTWTARAVDDEGDVSELAGPRSFSVDAAPDQLVPSVPGVPTNVSATPDNRSAHVTWTRPAGDGGSPIMSYTVTATPGGQTATVDGSTTQATVEGLINGVTYTFTVHATNLLGDGPPSSPSNAVTPRTIPDAPTGVSAVPGNQSATVSWQAPLSDGGAPISSYTVTASPGGRTATVGGDARSAGISGLTNYTSYTFTVHATNVAGNSPASAPSSPVTPAPTVPGMPTNVTATPGNGSATVSWTPPDDGGSPITSYTVTATPGGQTASASGSSTSKVVAGLTNGTSYTFTVKATNSVGTGSLSSPSNAVTPRTVPGAPTNVRALAQDKSAVVSWDAPASNGGSPITSYTVTSSPGGHTASVDGSQNSVAVGGLTNGTSYTFTVRAFNEAGEGPGSASSNSVTPEPSSHCATTGPAPLPLGIPLNPLIAQFATGIGVGTVIAVTPIGTHVFTYNEITVRRDTLLQGNLPEVFSLVLPSENLDGVPEVELGKSYLLYLRPMADDGTHANPPMELMYDHPGGALGIEPMEAVFGAGDASAACTPDTIGDDPTTRPTDCNQVEGDIPGDVSGFNVLGPDDDPHTGRSLDITYHISNSVPLEFRDNVKAAFQRWAAVSGGVTFTDGGPAGNAYVPDGVSIISWGSWPGDIAGSSDGAWTGVATPWSATDRDIRLNANPRYPDGTPARWSDTFELNSFDPEEVMLHEVGHVVGLDHVLIPRQVMCGRSHPWGGAPGPIRTLAAGEVAGLRSVRPGGITHAYYVLAADGYVYELGGKHAVPPNIRHFGDAIGVLRDYRAVGMAVSPSENGYWIVANNGGVFTFGDAPFKGSLGSVALKQPIVGMAATPSGQGYWLVAADGGVFAFGDAPFKGSMGGTQLNKPVVGMARTGSGQGYWLAAADGGIFSFGDAQFHGSLGAQTLSHPVVGMAATPDGGGYWMAAADAGVFSFGNAQFKGSGAQHDRPPDTVGMSAVPGTWDQYVLLRRQGTVYVFGLPFMGYLRQPLREPVGIATVG